MINAHWPLFGKIRLCNSERQKWDKKVAEKYVESDFFKILFQENKQNWMPDSNLNRVDDNNKMLENVRWL